MEEYRNFGEYMCAMRKRRYMTIRELAEAMDVSPTFIVDVEKSRRNPFPLEKLNELATILQLNDEEKQKLLNLAGKSRETVAPDLPDYIMNRDYVSAALRTARDLDAGEAEWQKFVDELRQRKG